MLSPSMPTLLVILVIVVVVFGAGKLPQLGGNLAKAIKNFKSGLSSEEKDQQAQATQGKIDDPAGQEKMK